jgi:hypothetical protein
MAAQRRKKITVRVSEVELERYQSLSEKSEKSLSELVRYLLDKESEKPT